MTNEIDSKSITPLDLARRVKLFELGQIVATPGVLAVCTRERMTQCLKAHQSCDCDYLSREDREANIEALSETLRIFSAYPIDAAKPCTGDNRLWIITEADRSDHVPATSRVLTTGRPQGRPLPWHRQRPRPHDPQPAPLLPNSSQNPSTHRNFHMSSPTVAIPGAYRSMHRGMQLKYLKIPARLISGIPAIFYVAGPNLPAPPLFTELSKPTNKQPA